MAEIAVDIFGFFKDEARTTVCWSYGLDMDWPKIRTVRGRGLDMDRDKSWLRSGSRTGHGYVCGQVANRGLCRGHVANCGLDRRTDWTDRGCGTDMDTARTCGHGLTADAGCGLDEATASRPDNGADISRLNRDHFADNRTLKIQGVRRPLLNSHKSCEHSRINHAPLVMAPTFRHIATPWPRLFLTQFKRTDRASETRSGTKQVGSGINERQRSEAWVQERAVSA